MVVRSVTQRIRNRFGNVAVAEVATQDVWDTATLGLACVSGDARHADEMLSKVLDFVAHERLDVDVYVLESEVIPF